jgi:hypothetical protein
LTYCHVTTTIEIFKKKECYGEIHGSEEISKRKIIMIKRNYHPPLIPPIKGGKISLSPGGRGLG